MHLIEREGAVITTYAVAVLGYGGRRGRCTLREDMERGFGFLIIKHIE
jgi:hypothetical protein